MFLTAIEPLFLRPCRDYSLRVYNESQISGADTQRTCGTFHMVTLFQKNRLGCLGPYVCTFHISGEVRVSSAIYVKGGHLGSLSREEADSLYGVGVSVSLLHKDARGKRMGRNTTRTHAMTTF